VLHGRDRECALLDDLLTAARAGRSGALVLRGEAGIGKSALLDHAARAARTAEMQVLSCTGIETESELAFSGLHRLLLPVLDYADAIPERQRAVLGGAFGIGPAGIQDRLLISLAVLSLLAEAAERAPLLCVVDDAQWLDAASTDALMFAARRVQAEGIAILLAARDDATRPFPAAGLPESVVIGLTAQAGAELLADRTPHAVADHVRDRLMSETLGNPLALGEVAALLSAEQLGGSAGLPARLPLGPAIEQLFLDQVTALPAGTRTMLLIAATDDSGQLPTILEAAARLDLTAQALDAAESAGLIRIEPPTVQFHHPLVRSAVYRGATFDRRRTVQQALADVLDDQSGPGPGSDRADRRAWLLAGAAAGPDADVADGLHAAGERARARGGHAAAAAAFDRAAALTDDVAVRAQRLCAAATSAWLAGQPHRARDLLDRAAPLAVTSTVRVDIEHLRGSIEATGGSPSVAYAMLLGAADLVTAEDPARAAGILTQAGQMAWASGDLARLSEAGQRLAALPVDPGDPGAAVIIGLTSFLRGDAVEAAAQLRQATDIAVSAVSGADPRSLTAAGAGAMFLGDDARAIDLFTRAVAAVRSIGAVSALPMVLAPLASLEAWSSRFPAAAADGAEGLRLAEDTGQHTPAAQLRGVLAWIAAVQGRREECADLAAAALSYAVGQRLGAMAAIAVWALAVNDLASGHRAEAFDRLEAIATAGPGETHQMVRVLSAADLVEVAVHTGQLASAQRAFDTLQQWAEQTGAQWSLALVARCRALLDAGGTTDHFAESLRLHAAAGRPFDAARTALLYGERLRRSRKRTEARKHLRSALDTFERLGAEPWAEQARLELLATGETARKRDDPAAITALTPQEAQIARLVGDGATNRAVAAQLFLSPRTVDYHLHKVFTKLGISSRRELMRISLQQDEPDPHGRPERKPPP
jgi:DNA-binding CsgD family transcriptional regulator